MSSHERLYHFFLGRRFFNYFHQYGITELDPVSPKGVDVLNTF